MVCLLSVNTSAKRARLKSPVRENRTPGSVRGRPGQPGVLPRYDGASRFDYLGFHEGPDLAPKSRDCIWKLYFGHFGSDRNGGIFSLAKLNQSKASCGDRWGFVTCNAHFLNSLIEEDHRIPGIGEGLSNVGPYSEAEYRGMEQHIAEANTIAKKNGGVQITPPPRDETQRWNYPIEEAKAQLEAAKEAARKECGRDKCCCKKITIETTCSSEFEAISVKQIATDNGINIHDRYVKNKGWVQTESNDEFINRARKEIKGKGICNRKFEFDCSNQTNQ